MTWTLGIDTSSVVSVGLANDESLVVSRTIDDTRAHAEQLTPLVQRVCAEAGIAVSEVTRVGVGLGPGPFTGLRVGIVTGRMLARLAGGGAKGVCSLDVLADQWVSSGHALGAGFVTVIDARRKEVYWAQYDASGRRLGEPRVTAPSQLPDLPLAGPGVVVLGDDPRIDSAGPQHVDGGVLAAHLDDLPDGGIEPLYLRKPDASEPTARKSTLVVPKLRRRP